MVSRLRSRFARDKIIKSLRSEQFSHIFDLMSVVRLNDLDFQASGARLEVKTSDNSKYTCRSDLVPVVQTLDSAIHWINHYPVDRY